MEDNNILPESTIKSLADKSYEKRKIGAQEIEQLVKSFEKDEQIEEIIKILSSEFIDTTNSNKKKGGLIGLAAIAIALQKEKCHNYINLLFSPILELLNDSDSRIRYYACEALYNVVKVTRYHILIFFNELFDKLCYLYSDVDLDVKNGAKLLDRLLKDIVSESYEHFNLEKFVPLLKERILIHDPFVQQLIISWITLIDSIPDLDIIIFIPEFLEGLFYMLSDGIRDIRQLTDSFLKELLKEISERLLELDIELIGKIISIIINQLNNSNSSSITRLISLDWCINFINIGQNILYKWIDSLVSSILLSTSNKDEEIQNKAINVNLLLFNLISKSSESKQLNMEKLLNAICMSLKNPYHPTRILTYNWLLMLLKEDIHLNNVKNHFDIVFHPLLNALISFDTDEESISLCMEVIARFSTINEERFNLVIHHILEMFRKHINLLESKGSIILRRLIVFVDGEKLFRAFAKLLLEENNLEFASTIVQTLNIILLTSPEIFQLRSKIKTSLLSNQNSDLFSVLFKTWCHNPVSAFSLCLFCTVYEMASELIFRFAEIEITVDFLMQIDRLVQLLESPIFLHLRFQLLEPQRNPFLIKCMYGLLMFLPQSPSFSLLQKRLMTISALVNIKTPDCATSSFMRVNNVEKNINIKELLDHFTNIQSNHDKSKKCVIQNNLERNEYEDSKYENTKKMILTPKKQEGTKTSTAKTKFTPGFAGLKSYYSK